MGIQGLLPMLKEISENKHIRDYAGQTIGIDAYVWLHREITSRYVGYAMSKLHMLQHFGITPYVVFDGGLLPSKMGTENDRQSKRADALARANSALAQGNATLARENFVKACDVTPAHAYQLIKELKRQGIQYIVAPYEADAQLCYLEANNIIDGIITEDSDLLVFGCKKVLYKFDKEGTVTEIRRERFSACKEFRFDGWTDTEFRHMAILGGCDYLDSMNGMGIKTAHQTMRKYKTSKKAIQSVRLNAKLTVPRDYEKSFAKADMTFQFQCVFDPVAKQLVHLNPVPPNTLSPEDLLHVGAGLDNDLALGIALGDIDPITQQAMVDIVPEVTTKVPDVSKDNRSAVSLYRPAKKVEAGPSTSKDIRNFFGAAPKAKSSSQGSSPPKRKRKPLSQVSANESPPKRARVEDGSCSQAPHVASRFFGQQAKASQVALQQSTSFVISDDEDMEDGSGVVALKAVAVDLGGSQAQPESPENAEHIISEVFADDLEADVTFKADGNAMLDDSGLDLGEVEVSKDNLPPDEDTSKHEEPSVAISSPSTSITSPPNSPAKLQQRVKKESKQVFSDEPISSPDAGPQTVPSGKVGSAKAIVQITSDISEFSDPIKPSKPQKIPAKVRQTKPPLKASTSTPKQERGRPVAQRAVSNAMDSEEGASPKADTKAEASIAASWRDRFMNPGTKSGSSRPLPVRPNVSGASQSASSSPIVKLELPREFKAAPRPSQKASQASKARPTKTASQPKEAVEKSTGKSKEAEPWVCLFDDEEEPTPTPWQKVEITETRLKAFAFKS